MKYPGGYDEENCQFVYEKLIQEEKIVPRGKDFEITLKSDEHGGLVLFIDDIQKRVQILKGRSVQSPADG